MTFKEKSKRWFLESQKTKQWIPLNIGKFRIGRLTKNDVAVECKNVSRVHCTLNLERDRVYLIDGSQFGTFVNDCQVQEMEPENGDVISLVNNKKVPKNNRDQISHFCYTLRKLDDQPEPEFQIAGEVLVSTKTEPIVISDDEEETPMKVINEEDFEIGESSKGKDVDSPMPEATSIPVRNDPVSKAVARLEARAKASEDRRLKQRENLKGKPVKAMEKAAVKVKANPLTSEIPRKAHIVKNGAKSSNAESNGLKMTIRIGSPAKRKPDEKVKLGPIPKLPKLDEHKRTAPPTAQKPRSPKFASTPAKKPKFMPITPSPSTSPPDYPQNTFNLDSLLTPQNSPTENEAVETDPMQTIVSSIINWDAESLCDKIYEKEPFYKNLCGVRDPIVSFDDAKHYEKVQANLMKCTIWHRLNHAFNILPRAADFNIVKIGHPGSNQLEFTCTSQALAKQSDKLMLKPGHVIMINAIIKSGMPEKRFLGYVTKAHKIDELVHFVVEVSNSHRDDVKISSKVSIIAECNVEGFITAYRLAYEASKSPLFEGIIAPSKLCSSSSNLPMCAKGIKQNSHLDTEQNKVFKSLYNNTIEALMNGKGYVSAVDGFPGSGKSRILTQLIVNLVTSKELTKKKQFKILVTCPSDLKLDALALQLKQFSHRSDAETFQKLDFLVYSVATSESQLKPHIINQRVDNLTKIDPKKYQNRHNTMMELIHKSQIVFTNVNIIYSLKNFCSKFDVILADDASEVDELNSMLSLSMSPSSFILFGDAYKRPINTLELSQKYNNINFNQSLFKRLTRFERCTQKLKFQYRLSSPVAHFLSVCFYGNTLPDCKRKFYDGNQRFELFHRNKDAFVFEFFEKAMQRFPEKATVNIILPPNINGIDLTKKLSAYASRIKISENINLPNKERDIVIICVNESMENLPRYRMSHLHGVFTLAKHAVYIIGTTNKLQHDPNWAHIFSYARKYNFEKNLNVENSNFIKEYFSQ